MKRITISFLVFLMTVAVFAQKQNFISIGFNNEKLSNSNMRTNLSFSYENQLSKHHGFVVGVNQRFSEKFFSNIQLGNSVVSFSVLEKFFKGNSDVSAT